MIKVRIISKNPNDALNVHSELREVPAFNHLISLPPIVGKVVGITWDLSNSDNDVIIVLDEIIKYD